MCKNEGPRSELFDDQPHNFEDKLLRHKMENSWLKTIIKNLGVGMVSFTKIILSLLRDKVSPLF